MHLGLELRCVHTVYSIDQEDRTDATPSSKNLSLEVAADAGQSKNSHRSACFVILGMRRDLLKLHSQYRYRGCGLDSLVPDQEKGKLTENRSAPLF